jgi:hypothetical protein
VIDIKTYGDSEMVAEINMETDDVRRYDEKATNNHIVGACTMVRSSSDDMWAP